MSCHEAGLVGTSAAEEAAASGAFTAHDIVVSSAWPGSALSVCSGRPVGDTAKNAV